MTSLHPSRASSMFGSAAKATRPFERADASRRWKGLRPSQSSGAKLQPPREAFEPFSIDAAYTTVLARLTIATWRCHQRAIAACH